MKNMNKIIRERDEMNHVDGQWDMLQLQTK
jgi:hypothetical protein